MVTPHTHQSITPGEILDFEHWINTNLEHTTNGIAFMPPSALRSHLDQRPRIRTILEHVGNYSNTTIDLDTVRRDYVAVLAILTVCQRSGYLEHFTKHPNLCDNQLPFLTQPDHFPSNDLWPDFFRRQWQFCPHSFVGHAHTHLHMNMIIPFLSKDTQVFGGTGEVSRVTIHPDFDRLASAEPRTDTKRYYALKTICQTAPRAKAVYDAETAAFTHFKRAGVQSDKHNIIAFYGGLVQGDTYSVLLEYAEYGSLEQFFQTFRLLGGHELLPMWKSMSGLLAAVDTIHSIPPDEDLANQHNRVIFKGWHQDLKPGNVLVQADAKSREQYVFKLADFGLSHFRALTADEEQSTEPLLDKDAGGTRAYGAPECYRGFAFQHPPSRVIGQRTDIWSMGAIYSEVVIWSVLGKSGLDTYRDQRLQATEAIDGHQDHGCFHDKQNRLPCVDAAHSNAIREARGTDKITTLIVSKLLPDMLCHHRGRSTAEQLLYKFEEIFKQIGAQQTYTLPRSESAPAVSEAQTSHSLRPELFVSTSPPHAAASHQHFNPRSTHLINESTAFALESPEQITGLPDKATADEIHDEETGTVPLQHYTSVRTSTALPGQTIAGLSRANTARLATSTSAPVKLTLSAVEEQMKQDKQRSFWKSGRKKFDKLLADLDTDETIRNLGGRDHVFLVDDSQSMNQYWPQVKILLKALAWLVSGDDDDGVELKFLRSTKSYRSKDPTKLIEHLDKARRAGNSDINSRLSEVLVAYRHRYGAWYNGKRRLSQRFSSVLPTQKPQSKYGEPKKLSIYILTDAIWQPKSDAADSIRPMVDKLVEWQCCANQVGIQFIRFGDDPNSIEKLERLDSGLGLQRDIVDHESSKGCLLKMINGAIDKYADADSDYESEEVQTGINTPNKVHLG